jgi:hypothetical protein
MIDTSADPNPERTGSTTPLTDRELAWFAGVVDVMGSVRLREVRGETLLPLLEINCPNLALLERLAALTGTSVTKVRRDYQRNGCTVHCPQAHVHIQSSSGRWSLSGARATVVLAALLPFLQLQQETVAELVAVGLRAPRKPATVAKMAALGWAAPEFLSDPVP